MPDDEGLREELVEALREHRCRADLTPDGDREQDYRPGAPCMDCGDYPGPRHERSDCPRALARAVLPVVERYAARRSAEALRPIHELFAGGPDTSCRTTWPDNGAGDRIECVEVPIEDLRRALDGTP